MSILITSSHCAVDLCAPDLSALDIRRDIAEPLARLPRFGGHMGERRSDGRIWSVAQHCVIGAKALLEETDDQRLAHLFVLHDAHEGLLGDWTTPVVRALLGDARTSAAKADILQSLRSLRLGIDAEIYRLAGLRGPTSAEAGAIYKMDMRMLAAEARQILGVDPAARPDLWSADVRSAAPVRTHGALSPWPTKRAADEWMALWDAWRIRTPSAAA